MAGWCGASLAGYEARRDDLAGDATSRLSVHLHFGCLSPLELAADVVGDAAQDRISEVAREFLARAGEPRDPVALRLRTAESGVLSASDTQRVAESILEHALLPLGATAVAVWLAGPDGSFTLTGRCYAARATRA